MLNLRFTTTDKLQLVTSAADAAGIVAVVTYVDTDETITSSSTPQPTRQLTRITTAATTDICATPASGKVRNIKCIELSNMSATVSNTLTPIYNNNGTLFELKPPRTLLARESWVRNDVGTWYRYDALDSVYGNSGPIVVPARNDFRLTGVSATPVMTADSTSLATIYLAQFKGNHLSLFDGLNWQDCVPASEISLAVTGRTTDLPFDIFAFLNAGVVTLEFTNWTSATARATALVRLDGVLVKSGDSTRRWLGSCRARSATSFHQVRDGTDLPCKFDLFNADNRVEHAFQLRASTNTWAYTLATWRQAQASANYQVDVMVGIQEEFFQADLLVSSRNATISIPRQVGIGYDSTVAIAGCTNSATANTVASIECDQNARIGNMPTVGRHFYAWLEISTATGTCTWIGDDGALRLQSGMSGMWKC